MSSTRYLIPSQPFPLLPLLPNPTIVPSEFRTLEVSPKKPKLKKGRKQYVQHESDEIVKTISLESSPEKEIAALAKEIVPDLLVEKLPLCQAFAFKGKPESVVDGNNVNISIPFSLRGRSLNACALFVRWGSYEDIADRWVDLRVEPSEISNVCDGEYRLVKSFAVERKGYYGATVFAEDPTTGERIWQGNGFADDARFRIDINAPKLAADCLEYRHRSLRSARELLKKSLADYTAFGDALVALSHNGCKREISNLIYQESRHDFDLRTQIASHYFQALDKSEIEDPPQSSPRTQTLINILGSIGVGEVVLVAPEGPHATVGGLAQVMTGMLRALPELGVPVTLISPIYEYDQGTKHPSAEELLRRGIRINGHVIHVKYAGEVEVPFGPTYWSNRGVVRHHDYRERIAVYSGEHGSARLLLLRHRRFADRLYPPRVNPDEHLRRAIFLSRGALEVMKEPIFDVHPQVIASNDWISALVPVFLKLDLRYCLNENIGPAKAVHIVHNCGRDYHGCIPVRAGGEELWPMLELSSEHYASMTDPHNYNLLNLTAGAIRHLDGALVAVSKPYAQQLLTREGGEGLDQLVSQKRSFIFGISNGINQETLRRHVIRVGESARAKLGEPRLLESEEAISGEEFAQHLPQYKDSIKRALQGKLSLSQGSEKILLSFVGRLAEQKGIQLLSGCAQGDGISVMEFLLRRYPEVQLVFAGPPVPDDRTSSQFINLVNHLSWAYKGRVVGMFDFVPHEFAMEIFAASDFSLMPSRFEPGGLTQLESLACGTLVIARNVGGIKATLQRFDDSADRGNGFLFDEFSSTAVRNTICWAIDRTRSPEFRHKLIREAALTEHDWNHRAFQYVSLFQHINGVLSDANQYPHLEARGRLVEDLRA